MMAGAAAGEVRPVSAPQRGGRAVTARLLPDGRRLHLSDGPIDLVIRAFGEPDAVTRAYGAACSRFDGLLDELCAELPLLRRHADPECPPQGPIALRMWRAVLPLAGGCFITPMAAVAGAVAEEILAAMTGAAPLERAYVNNGGDIAVHLAPGTALSAGLVDRPDRPSLFGAVEIRADMSVRGLATSGWRGRSFSLGIADAVTVLARTAAMADAAATVIANAIDLADHPGIRRRPARDLQPDSDLGDRLVTVAVDGLSKADIDQALTAGSAEARRLHAEGLIDAAALRLGATTHVVGSAPLLEMRQEHAGVDNRSRGGTVAVGAGGVRTGRRVAWPISN